MTEERRIALQEEGINAAENAAMNLGCIGPEEMEYMGESMYPEIYEVSNCYNAEGTCELPVGEDLDLPF